MADTSWASRLTDQVQTIVEQQMAPGLALAVARNGEPIYCHGFGYRNAAAKLPVTENTVFGVASVTKSLTCLAVMQLADRARLAVSDPVVKWLPEFRLPHPAWTGQVTIHHLMTHTSGLPELTCLQGALAGSAGPDPHRHQLGLAVDPRTLPPVRTYADLLRVMAETDFQPLGAPGTAFNYSNEGYALLQGIIERAAGQDFLSYAQQQILDPIGMAHSTFRVEELARFPEVTELYVADVVNGRTEAIHAPGWWDYGEIYTTSCLKASAGDLLKYLEVYRTGGLAGGTRILSEVGVRQMMSPHMPQTATASYGYGLTVESLPGGLTVVHHWGSNKGVASHVAVVPERGLTAVTLSNLTHFDSMRVGLLALSHV